MTISDQIYRQIMWDYSIPKEEIEKLLSGEIQYAGHYDYTALAVKIFNNLSWYQIIKIYSLEKIQELLTEDFINKIRFKTLKQNYESLRKILCKETLPDAKWGTANDDTRRYPVLSNRWYSFK